jgi:hypothetical protein
MDDCHDFRPSAADFRAIFKALDEATAPVAGHAQPQPLAVLLHDCRGVVMGGYGAGPSIPGAVQQDVPPGHRQLYLSKRIGGGT